MLPFNPEKYKTLIEHSHNPHIRKFIARETEALKKTLSNGYRTVIDIGAGYGRLLKLESDSVKRCYLIEINEHMYSVLLQNAQSFPNAKVYLGDALNMKEYLPLEQGEPLLFVITQNTIGTLNGTPEQLFKTIRKIARNHLSEVFITYLNESALIPDGLNIYSEMKDMVGEVDMDKTRLGIGEFISKTGYKSKWWTPEEMDIHVVQLGGHVAYKERDYCFTIQHITLDKRT